MKSDKEFIEGIYMKARQQELDMEVKDRSGRGMLFYAKRYVPAAVCLLLLFVLVPRYFVKKPNQGLEPDIAPFQLEDGSQEIQNRNELTRNFSEDGDTFSVDGTGDNSPMTVEQAIDPIVMAEIKEVSEKDGILYILASVKSSLQGVTGELLLIQYSNQDSSDEVEFIKGEQDILYLAAIFQVDDENAVQKQEEYNTLYEELFSDSDEYVLGVVPDVFALIDGVNGKFTYVGDRDGIAVYESVNGIQVTEDELRTNGR